jgi:hypothetical protein
MMDGGLVKLLDHVLLFKDLFQGSFPLYSFPTPFAISADGLATFSKLFSKTREVIFMLGNLFSYLHLGATFWLVER